MKWPGRFGELAYGEGTVLGSPRSTYQDLSLHSVKAEIPSATERTHKESSARERSVVRAKAPAK